jgi:hypothetical protein
MGYDLFEKIRAILDNDKDQSLDWLVSKMGKSKKWFYNNRDIGGVALEDLLKLNSILKTDFLGDYNTWLIENNKSPISLVGEPDSKYKKEKDISVQIKITGTPQAIGLGFADLIKTISKEAEKLGLEIQ